MLLQDYLRLTPESAKWASRAQSVLPDGIATDTRLFQPYGLYITHAEGVFKTDVDGNRLLDFFGGHGALVLGHGHPRVMAAVVQAQRHGIQYAANHPLEVRWAERVVRHFESIEQVRFTGSGTEATLLAIRMARAFTGRSKIVRIATHYHGWHDFASSGYNANFDGAPAPGVLREIAENTILVLPNDKGGLSAAFERWGDSIAAVMAEPLGSHFGIVPTNDDFLLEVQSLARKYGAVFILDEVISGFRVSANGMQGLLGLSPDLTTLGKAAAGGQPGGIVGGRTDIMSVLRSDSPVKVLHQGTFTGNPVTAAAAIATIDEIAENDVCQRINSLGDYLRLKLNELFQARGTRWFAHGRFSSAHLCPLLEGQSQPDLSDPLRTPRFSPSTVAALRMSTILEGVDIGGRGSFFLSSQHTSEHIDCMISALSRALDRIEVEGLVAV